LILLESDKTTFRKPGALSGETFTDTPCFAKFSGSVVAKSGRVEGNPAIFYEKSGQMD